MLDMLMAATKKGGPLQNVGLRGRLGDLGTIDPEFDVAIRYTHFTTPVLRLSNYMIICIVWYTFMRVCDINLAGYPLRTSVHSK